MTRDVRRDTFEARDGASISYLQTGSGIPVLLLHALSASAEMNWLDTGVLTHVAERGAEVTALDLRGHGGSAICTDEERCSLATLVADAEDAMDRMASHGHIVGYSLGALVAAHVAAAGRVPLSSLVLSGIGAGTVTFGSQDGRMVDAMVDALLTPDPADIADPMGRAFRTQVDAWGAVPSCVAALLRDLQQTHDVELGRIRVPTLVLNGVADAPPSEIGDRIPGARLGTVPGDHLSAPLHPEFAQAISRFLLTGDGASSLHH